MSGARPKDALGVYVSVPFCRAKCSFCNFASGVFVADRQDPYLASVADEVRGASAYAARLGAALPEMVDTVYLGGGTPSLLTPGQLRPLFATLRQAFAVQGDAEITVEAAPGQLADDTLAALLDCGVNRLSFGVQSFVDAEAAAVGRLHTGAECLRELDRVRRAGIARVGIDLIAGLPGQTLASWERSVRHAIASGVEHVSVYMLEVDEGSRLGREALAGGTRYGAGTLPENDLSATCCEAAVEWLEGAGIAQYEISNFARPGGVSRHNLRYWQRRPYVGFGLDAHSMLRVGEGGVRWANGDALEHYGLPGAAAWERTVDRVDTAAAFEETLFLGLRLVEGICTNDLRQRFGSLWHAVRQGMDDSCEAGLLTTTDGRLRLTAAGRMASNEVFERLLLPAAVCAA